MSIDDIKMAVTAELNGIGVGTFQKAFIDLHNHSYCMEMEGDYVEAYQM